MLSLLPLCIYPPFSDPSSVQWLSDVWSASPLSSPADISIIISDKSSDGERRSFLRMLYRWFSTVRTEQCSFEAISPEAKPSRKNKQIRSSCRVSAGTRSWSTRTKVGCRCRRRFVMEEWVEICFILSSMVWVERIVHLERGTVYIFVGDDDQWVMQKEQNAGWYKYYYHGHYRLTGVIQRTMMIYFYDDVRSSSERVGRREDKKKYQSPEREEPCGVSGRYFSQLCVCRHQ